jgi:hypothetical protein
MLEQEVRVLNKMATALYKMQIASVNTGEADKVPGSILQKIVRIKNTVLSGKINGVGNRADFHSTERCLRSEKQ